MKDEPLSPTESDPGDDETRFVTLLDGYWDRELRDEETQSLSEMLVADAGRRTLFVDIATQRNALAEIYENEEYVERATRQWSLPDVTGSGGPRISRWSQTASTLAVSLLIYGGFFLISWGIWRKDLPGEPVSSPRAIASVEAEEDCVWGRKPGSEPNGKLKPGTALVAGQPLELRRGCAEFEFENGVRLSVAAPCRMRLDSVGRITLEEGRIYAVVPKRGTGFTVETREATFIDRGTRFGVEVSANRQTALHVFEGRVDSYASGAGNRGQKLVAGESIQFAGQQTRRAVADMQPFRQAMALAQRQSKSTPVTKQQPAKTTEVAQVTDDTKQPAAKGEGEVPVGATLLVDLEPSQVEYGLVPDPNKMFKEEGPGKMDPRCRGRFWPNDRKIVKAIAADAAVPEGKPYRTALYNDFFAVGGEFVTGVGFWARSRCMYHWLEYDIPAGATRFTGKLLISDDPTNAEYPSANQNFYFMVSIDGKEVVKENKLLPKQVFGSGKKLADLDVAIPAGAKKIRFRLESTPWGDGNLNNEVIVSEGTFTGGDGK